MRSAEELGKAIEEPPIGPGPLSPCRAAPVAGGPHREAGAGGASQGSSGRHSRVLSWEFLSSIQLQPQAVPKEKVVFNWVQSSETGSVAA